MGRLVELQQTPVITAAAYAATRRLGSIMTFTDVSEAPGKSGWVKQAVIVDSSNQKSAMTLWLFRNLPVIVSADNTALDTTNANLLAADPVGFISFLAGDYVSTASGAVAYKALGTAGVAFVTAGAGTIPAGPGALYGLLQCNGTPTYGATNALQVTIFVDQDT